MKKLSILLIAAATLSLTSCGGGKDAPQQDAASQEAAQAAVQDGVKYEGDNYTITYPKGWQETSGFGDMLNAMSADGEMKLIANYQEDGPAISELSTYATNLKAFHQNGKLEEPVFNDKVMTMKAVDEGNVEIHFAVMKEDKKGVIGSLKFPEAKSSDADAILQGILGSIVFK